MEFKAILFDTRSIQKYIFSGNKLKTNIGASYLVELVFDKTLLEVLNGLLGSGQVDSRTWKEVAAPDWNDMPCKARVGYIGGGNALLIFDKGVEDAVLHKVVYEFTKKLLTDYPGLRTGAAIGSINLDGDGTIGADAEGVNDLSRLVYKLKEYQSSVFPNVNVAYTGLTQVCNVNGEVANAYDRGSKRFFSQEVMSKIRANTRKNKDEDGEADKALYEKLQEVFGQDVQRENILHGFAFPKDLKHLGQKETENYYAIVHIDGNNMGQKFADCKTLTERKNKSIEIRRKTIWAFCELVANIIENKYSYNSELKLHVNDRGLYELPIRPLVLGGDDMTFVCSAKMALHNARLVMQYMLDKGIDTCCGMAIVPTNYPFFRGYTLAEQLCDAAKNEMRRSEKEPQSCWLDFAILHGEQPPTLEQIRGREYRSSDNKNMHFGPYRLDGDKAAANNLAQLEKGIMELAYAERRMPMNKIKDMRYVLPRSEHIRKQFVQQLGAGALPNVAAWTPYEENLWHDGRTPYLDAIEMIDFYLPGGDEVHG